MTEKANKRWEMSLRLGMPGTRRTYVGTFYGAGDTYHHMVESGVKLHFHSCYVVNESSSQFSKDGIPVRLVVDREQPLLRSREYLKSEEEQGVKTFAVQMLGIPTSAEITDFNTDLICRYYAPPKKVREGQNVIFVIDPAGRRGDESHSRFAMGIWGLHYDENYYLLDCVIDRLNLGQRIDVIFKKHRQWRPIEVRYESNGYNADIEAVEMAMQYRNYRFIITPVFAQGTTKNKRVERLIPIMNNRRIYVPDEGISYLMQDTNQLIDVVDWWITKELMPFPNVGHLDFSDAASRIEEPGHVNLWPAAPPAPQDPWRMELDENRQDQVLDWMRM
jgi:phage terminase large subunit-like protein